MIFLFFRGECPQYVPIWLDPNDQLVLSEGHQVLQSNAVCHWVHYWLDDKIAEIFVELDVKYTSL